MRRFCSASFAFKLAISAFFVVLPSGSVSSSARRAAASLRSRSTRAWCSFESDASKRASSTSLRIERREVFFSKYARWMPFHGRRKSSTSIQNTDPTSRALVTRNQKLSFPGG